MKDPGFTLFVFVVTVVTSAASVQAQPRPENKSAPDVLAGVQIVQASDGVWKCLNNRERPCSPVQWKAVVTKSRSNTNDNLFTMATDGTVKCVRVAGGKPCPPTAVKEFSEAVKKAVTEKGISGY
jgi:hypothetical protein